MVLLFVAGALTTACRMYRKPVVVVGTVPDKLYVQGPVPLALEVMVSGGPPPSPVPVLSTTHHPTGSVPPAASPVAEVTFRVAVPPVTDATAVAVGML
jgi:hypothetical protein